MPAANRTSPATSSPYITDDMAVTLHRSALGAWWRWRTELAVVLVLAAAACWLRVALGSWLAALLVLVGLVLVLALAPWPRRFLTGRFWAVFHRHRLQRAFWELRLHTRAGRLPLIARVASTPVGSRAVVICRAGLCAADFEDAADQFASACGAREARVTCSPRWSWLIYIDVMRRDVLGPARIIRNPLADLPDPAPVPVPAAILPAPARVED